MDALGLLRRPDDLEETEGIWAAFLQVLERGWIQSIVDLRRGMDFLETCDEVDADRVGYIGISMGAMMGGVVSGVDERIDAAVLIIGGSWGSDDATEQAAGLDPATFIALMEPRPLLMLNGRNDTIVPRAWTDRLYEAAAEPKRIVCYDAGHWVPPVESMKEIRSFLEDQLK